MKTGPNDARCVVWALGEFFYILNRVFLKNELTFYCIYSCYLRNKRQERMPDILFVPYVSFFFFDTTNILLYIYKF